jgi:predicted MFS family arabinose efflux permease
MKKLIRSYTSAYDGLSRASWMLALVLLINRTGSMVLPFLGVYMIDHLHFTLASSGLVLSCYGLGSLAGSFIGGQITDKKGPFAVQTFSLFTSVLLFCLMPLFKSVLSLSVMIFVLSTISEMFRPANSVAITQHAKPENLTRAFSLNRMAVNLGFSMGPAIGGLLAGISYDLLFFANAATTLVAGICYVAFFRRYNQVTQRRAASRKQQTEEHLIKEKSPYSDLPFIVFCVFCSLFSICFFQLLNTLPLFYKEAVKLESTTIGVLLGYSGIVVVLLEMSLVSFAERRLTVAKTMLIGSLICAVSYGMLGFTHHLLLLFVSISLLSCGEILLLPFMATVTAFSSGKRNKGAYMGMNGISVSIAFIISPALGSWVAMQYGFSLLWISTALLLLISGFGFYYSVLRLQRKAGATT